MPEGLDDIVGFNPHPHPASSAQSHEYALFRPESLKLYRYTISLTWLPNLQIKAL